MDVLVEMDLSKLLQETLMMGHSACDCNPKSFGHYPIHSYFLCLRSLDLSGVGTL